MSENIPHLITNLLDDKQLHLPKGTKLSIVADTSTSPKYTEKPPFIMVGNGMKNRTYQAYPLLETLLELSKPEAWLFKILLDMYNDQTGLSILTVSFSGTDKVTASKAYKSLNQRDLVRRVKRQVYMINPCALITNQWKEHIKIWESLTPKPIPQVIVP